MIKNVSWSCNLHNRKHPEKMEIFILFAGFITVASPGYKTWIQFERNYSHSVLNFNFYGKTIRRQMYFQGLKLDFNSTRWMPNLVSLDAQSYAALAWQSLRATISPLLDNLSHRKRKQLTLHTECYLTNTRAFFPIWTFI